MPPECECTPKALCRCIDRENTTADFLAEPEIYVNFLLKNNYKLKWRKLKRKDMKFDLVKLGAAVRDEYDFVTCHAVLG